MFLKELEAERQLKMEEVSRSIHPSFSPLVCASVFKVSTAGVVFSVTPTIKLTSTQLEKLEENT